MHPHLTQADVEQIASVVMAAVSTRGRLGDAFHDPGNGGTVCMVDQDHYLKDVRVWRG